MLVDCFWWQPFMVLLFPAWLDWLWVKSCMTGQWGRQLSGSGEGVGVNRQGETLLQPSWWLRSFSLGKGSVWEHRIDRCKGRSIELVPPPFLSAFCWNRSQGFKYPLPCSLNGVHPRGAAMYIRFSSDRCTHRCSAFNEALRDSHTEVVAGARHGITNQNLSWI